MIGSNPYYVSPSPPPVPLTFPCSCVLPLLRSCVDGLFLCFCVWTQVTLGETWIEDDTGGLFHAKVNVSDLPDAQPDSDDEAGERPRRRARRNRDDCALM